MSLGAWVVLLALVVTVAGLWRCLNRREHVDDPGPWREDGRFRRDGQCQGMSLSSGQRCAHRAGHKRAHDAPLTPTSFTGH